MIPSRSRPVVCAHTYSNAFGMARRLGTCSGRTGMQEIGADVSYQPDRCIARGEYPRLSKKSVQQRQTRRQGDVATGASLVPRLGTVPGGQVLTPSVNLRNQSGKSARMKFTGPPLYGGSKVQA